MKNIFKNITARKVLQICSWAMVICILEYVFYDVVMSFLRWDIQHILRAVADIVILIAASHGVRSCYTTGKEPLLFKQGIFALAASVIGTIVWFAFIFVQYGDVADMLIRRSNIFYLIHILWSLGYFFAARRILAERGKTE